MCQVGGVWRFAGRRGDCWDLLSVFVVIENEDVVWWQASSLMLVMVFPFSSQQNGTHLKSVNFLAPSSG